MNLRIVVATAGRIGRQLRHDPRTIGLVLFVPSLLLTLMYFVFDGSRTFDRAAVLTLGTLPMLGMFLVTSITMQRERGTGTLERLFTTPITRIELLAGYGLAFAVLAVVQATILWVVIRFGFGITTRGSMVWMLVIAAAAASVGVAIGLLASAFAETEFQAAQFMPVVIGPQLFLCGLLTPHAKMPLALQYASEAMPMTHAVDGMLDVATKVAPGADVARAVLILLAFAVGALLLATLSMPRRTR